MRNAAKRLILAAFIVLSTGVAAATLARTARAVTPFNNCDQNCTWGISCGGVCPTCTLNGDKYQCKNVTLGN